VRVLLILAVALLAGCGGTSSPSTREVSDRTELPTIVIEHGAFADASGWSDVIARLQRRGYHVVAPANPLRSVAFDAGYLQSVVESIRTPVVLVGHSYGGAVITNVAAPNVKSLVYIAAVAPDKGESQADIFARFPGSQLGPKTIVERPFPGGTDQYVKASSYRDVFSADRPAAAAAPEAATQRPLAKAAVTEESGTPAWRTVPSWFMVAAEDRAIPPKAERFMAERMHARTVEVRSSHFVMLSHPNAVTKLILEAAASK
jgi:pimeloyl-ACP methyl ester carboxylesterase